MNNSHINYEEIVERLRTIRKRKKITQKEMGEILGVTQSYYQRLEKGVNIISKNSIKKMAEKEEDVFGLITGKWNDKELLDKYVYRYEDVDKTKILLQMMIILLDVGIWISEIDGEVSLNKAYYLMKICELDEKNIWKKIRFAENLTQVKMAEILGIDVQKYRRMEKDGSEEDGEIFLRLYENLNYSPMLMIDRRRFCLDEMNYVFSQFSDNLQVRIVKYIDEFIDLMDSK